MINLQGTFDWLMKSDASLSYARAVTFNANQSCVVSVYDSINDGATTFEIISIILHNRVDGTQVWNLQSEDLEAK